MIRPSGETAEASQNARVAARMVISSSVQTAGCQVPDSRSSIHPTLTVPSLLASLARLFRPAEYFSTL